MKIALLTTDNREDSKKYFLSEPYFGTAPEALLQGFAALPDIEIHVLSCAQQRMKSPEKLAPNIFFHSLHVPKFGWLRTAYQGCIRAVRKKLSEIKPDIVHGQGTERYCALSAALSGFPNVVTIHGNMAELARLFHAPFGSYHWMAAQFENFTLRRTAGVFCNSAYTENLVQPRARRTWRVPNPIREQFFSTPLPAMASQKCILVNVGVISQRKRQAELLELGEKLYREGLSFEFKFIGHIDDRNPYAVNFLEQIKKAEAVGYARYLGCKSAAELIGCFDNASALLHFPIEESFGLVVAEALSRNLKLFGANVGGIIDIASTIPGVELFALEDWNGLSAAIAKWIRECFPKISSTNLISRYRPQIIAKRHLEIYAEVLNKPS